MHDNDGQGSGDDTDNEWDASGETEAVGGDPWGKVPAASFVACCGGATRAHRVARSAKPWKEDKRAKALQGRRVRFSRNDREQLWHGLAYHLADKLPATWPSADHQWVPVPRAVRG